MVRLSSLLCASLLAQCNAQFLRNSGFSSYSMSWSSFSQAVGGHMVQETHRISSNGQETEEVQTKITQDAGGQAVREVHGISSNGQEIDEIRSILTQDRAGALHGTKDEVRCVGRNCAERLSVVGPPPSSGVLRGAEAPCHKKHVAAMAAQAAAVKGGAQPSVEEASASGVNIWGSAWRFHRSQLLHVMALGAFIGAAFGSLLVVAAVRMRKAHTQGTQMQSLRQMLLPSRPSQPRPTEQDELRAALRDLGNNAIEAYVCGLYARGLHKADVANTNAEARAYVQQLCERACLA